MCNNDSVKGQNLLKKKKIVSLANQNHRNMSVFEPLGDWEGAAFTKHKCPSSDQVFFYLK